jgi:hypothetical protein
MSKDPHHETFIQHHGPVEAEPVAGHADTTFEGTDASVKIIIGSLLVIALTLVITGLIVLPIQNVLKTANPPGQLPSPLAPARVIPPAPVLQVHPWETFPDLLAEQEKQLNSYGKDPDGHVHVPIQQAMTAVLPTLKAQPNAPEGITIPGGQGRDFAKGLSAMPPAYQQMQPQVPTIQGEIRKNAKK